MSPSRSSKSESSFCERITVRDYLVPLRNMDPVHMLPVSGHLPFAPDRVSIRAVGDGLRVGRGSVGFFLSDRAVNQVRPLKWVVHLKLTLISHRGEDRRVLSSRSQRLGRVIIGQDLRQLTFQVPDRLSFYRVDISFRRFDGALLGSYGQYFRVVHPFERARLALDRPNTFPGGILFGRVENLGTAPLTPESEARIERRQGQEWIQVASVVAEGLKPEVRERVEGGRSGPCFSVEIPADFATGRYRLIDEIRNRFPGPRVSVLSAAFDVS